ncbi:MAG TPA: hypothetical protein VHT91_49400 [Kofleriaceae bacterium]|jgi:hypothetical protein|nr:hypothetical protein [Kofleriaceae bacterium]
MQWACAAIALSACYSPNLAGGSPCELTTRLCPTGQSCIASGGAGAGICMPDRSATTDAGTGTSSDGGTCLGGHLLGSVCVSAAPAGPITLTAVGGPINSGTVAAGGCTELVPQTGGPALCVIAGTTIDIPAAVTVRAFAVSSNAAATGTNPLVLFATDSITIEGSIDAASHINDTLAGGIPALGAGARTAVGCAVTGLDGVMGKPVGGSSQDSYGGGGGAGGSFGTLGGAGGNGGNNNNVGHGNPVLGSVPSLVVGGCPGGSGGPGDGGGGVGIGGAGGGAIYLLAANSITIAGKINASGAGGSAGGSGNFSSGGGGGGGAGGMIGLEAGTVAIMTGAAVFANGGGGASGSGQTDGDSGSPGTDPTGPATAAGAGPGKDGGGAGGAGSVSSGTGAAGTKGGGNNTAQECAGGGGGGGGGVIRIFSTQPAMIQGAVSPPAP